MRMMNLKRWMIVVLCLMMVGATAQATSEWDNGGSDNYWSNDANWFAAEPTASVHADFNSTAGSTNGTASIGTNDGSSPYAAVCNDLRMDLSGGNVSKLIIERGSSLTTGGQAHLGYDNGQVYITANYGTTVNIGSYINMGKSAGAYVSIHVRGNSSYSSSLSADYIMVGGDAGTGVFNQQGADVDFAGMYIGSNGAGVYTLQDKNGHAAVLNNTSRTEIGDNSGSTGTFTQKANTTFNHTSVDRFFIIGNSGAGTYNMEGGTLNIPNGVEINVGRYATGIMNQTGGDINAGDSTLLLAYSANSGTYNMDAGTLTAADLISGGGVASADFNFTAGDIYLEDLDGSKVGFAAANAWFNVTGPNPGLYTETWDGIDTTHLYYIPEPATLGVLCLGAMLSLLRRKK